MKKNFTNPSKFPFVIITAIIGLACAFYSSAEEYKSMIRYDRVWEHVYIYWGDMRIYHVRFDGVEEINGKTYHRLIAFRKATFDYNSNHQPYLTGIDDTYYQHEGYLREESGKLYTLVAKCNADDPFGWTELYTADNDYEDPYVLEEKLIYDFTRKEGESYKGLQSDLSDAEVMDYKVLSVENIVIDGENHRLQRIVAYNEWSNEWYDTPGEPIVEGIGITSYGCLTTINFLRLPTCPCNNHIFNRVLTTDGEVIYRNQEDCVDIPINDFLRVESILGQTMGSTIFDILGRRLTEPAPGQLYIQDGKKHIAK